MKKSNIKVVDVIIIGSGIVGSMVKKVLSSKFNDIQIIDSNNPMGASKCSFGVWKDGWIAGLGDKAQIGIEVAKNFVDVEVLKFYNADKKQMEDFYRLDCSKIIEKPTIIGTVKSIKNDIVSYYDSKIKIDKTLKAKHAVIVCAGVWTNEILIKSGYTPESSIDSQWGKVYRFSGNVKKNKMSMWAPFKQNVLFNEDVSTYIFGDGCTVKNPKPGDKRIEIAEDRLLLHAQEIGCNFDNVLESLEGYRPYLSKGGEIVNRYDDKLWSAVGTAKNGTVLSGWIALQFLNIFEES